MAAEQWNATGARPHRLGCTQGSSSMQAMHCWPPVMHHCFNSLRIAACEWAMTPPAATAHPPCTCCVCHHGAQCKQTAGRTHRVMLLLHLLPLLCLLVSLGGEHGAGWRGQMLGKQSSWCVRLRFDWRLGAKKGQRKGRRLAQRRQITFDPSRRPCCSLAVRLITCSRARLLLLSPLPASLFLFSRRVDLLLLVSLSLSSARPPTPTPHPCC